jgi:hypothetical protein
MYCRKYSRLRNFSIEDEKWNENWGLFEKWPAWPDYRSGGPGTQPHRITKKSSKKHRKTS